MTESGNSGQPAEGTAAQAWTVTPAEAIAIQQRLRTQVVLEPLNQPVRHIAGADVSMNLYSNVLYAGFVVLSWPELRPVDEAAVVDVTEFPYVPGLLSFREIPALLKAWTQLRIKPDLVVVDGTGVAHPRRLGIASHLGICLEVPTIGCAKSVLTGVYDEPAAEAGGRAPLRDRLTQEVIGMAVRTKPRSNPVFVSAGHRITLAESVDFIQRSLRGYRLPEQTRRAHHFVNSFRRNATGQSESELPLG